MKRTIIYILLAFMALGAQAETAAQVLAKVNNTLRQMGACKIAFSLSASNAAQTVTEHGTLTLSGIKFTCQTSQGTVWYDGTTQWTYAPAQKEITVTEPYEEEMLETNPLSILQNWQQLYTVTIAKTTNTHYTLRFVPKQKGSMISSATAVISRSSWQPSSVDMTMANGAKMQVSVKSLHKIAPPSIATFRCNPGQYPGATLVDLR